MTARAILLMLCVTGGPAMACLPDPGTPSDVPVRGVNCEIWYQATDIARVGLGQARDLGQGIVIQSAYDSNGCFGETSMIVSDCNLGQVRVLGTYDWAVERYEARPTRLERMVEKVETAVAGGRGDALARAEAAARASGFDDVLRLRTKDRIKMRNRLIGLTCACKSFYPGLKPGA